MRTSSKFLGSVFIRLVLTIKYHLISFYPQRIRGRASSIITRIQFISVHISLYNEDYEDEKDSFNHWASSHQAFISLCSSPSGRNSVHRLGGLDNKTIKDGDIAPWKNLQKKWTKIKEKDKEIFLIASLNLKMKIPKNRNA